MTLPFRRRHHDAEAGHDRARQLWSVAMIEPLDERDSAWLDAHLEGCAECRLERDAQAADQSLLRALRDRPIVAPRDLWARTAAAIERESGRQSRGALGLPGNLVPARARLPLGILSGVLVVLVVVAVSFAPGSTPQVAIASPSGGLPNVSPAAVASQIAVAAARVTYVQAAADGTIRIINADVDEVCPTGKSGCAPLQQRSQSSLSLGAPPQALVASPQSDQLVVVAGKGGSHAGSVIVVPVPTPAPSGAPVTPPATSLPSTPSAPPASGGPSGGPTPAPTPEGAHSIAEGVVVVGEARYSADGHWLAFSAAPLDGSTGPDLYIWNGTDPAAIPVTTDHETYFSGWLGGRILASRLVAPVASVVPTGSGAAAGAAAAPSAAAGSSAAASPIVLELQASSFLFDPVSLTTQPLARPGVWLPTVDPSGRFVTYWDGTLLAGPGVDGVQLGTGHLVLDGWLDPLEASGASESGPATGAPAAPAPGTSGTPGTSSMPLVGPAGTPIELAPGPITAFEARFDPSGTRLAVWVADPSDPTVGTLRLVVLDRGHGHVDSRPSPLPSVRALKGISIEEGRLAWVTPPGQDGNQSSVHVLAWSNDDFGQVETLPGEQLTIVH